jgi:hypothetical protein
MSNDDNILQFAKIQQDGPEWLRAAIMGKHGEPLAVVANAIAALEANMPEHFGFDEML